MVRKNLKRDPELGKYWASLGMVAVNAVMIRYHQAFNAMVSANVEKGC